MERPGREKSVGRSSGSWAGLVSGISNNRLTGVVLIVFPEDPGKLECLAAADREPEPHLLLAHPLPLRRQLVTVGAAGAAAGTGGGTTGAGTASAVPAAAAAAVPVPLPCARFRGTASVLAAAGTAACEVRRSRTDTASRSAPAGHAATQ